jgi:hypothetical protein
MIDLIFSPDPIKNRKSKIIYPDNLCPSLLIHFLALSDALEILLATLSPLSSARGINLIKHEIDDDACDRDVQPHRESPASDTHVLGELPARGAIQCDPDEWDDDRCQNRVRDQDDEIDGTHQPLPCKTSRAVKIVIGQIRNEKKRRSDERCDQAVAVSSYFAPPDKKIARDEKKSARGIQDGVQVRQGVDILHQT